MSATGVQDAGFPVGSTPGGVAPAAPLRVVFLCGERSPWGLAHLPALLNDRRFQIVRIVLASDARWASFRRAVGGERDPGLRRPRVAGCAIKSLMRRAFAALKPRQRTMTDAFFLRLGEPHAPVTVCDDVHDPAILALLQRDEADVLFCAAYPQILKPALLSLYPGRAFNSHPSLLPRCRGAHPVFWAIASGERSSGGTIHYLTDEIDAGDIVAQVEAPMADDVSYRDLYGRLKAAVPALIDGLARFLSTPGSKGRPQDNARATFFRNDRLIHHRIFWSMMTAVEIDRLVRACNGEAFFYVDGVRARLIKVRVAAGNRNVTNHWRVPPGAIVDFEGEQAVVAAQSGFVRLERMVAPRRAWRPLQIGQVLS